MWNKSSTSIFTQNVRNDISTWNQFVLRYNSIYHPSPPRLLCPVTNQQQQQFPPTVIPRKSTLRLWVWNCQVGKYIHIHTYIHTLDGGPFKFRAFVRAHSWDLGARGKTRTVTSKAHRLQLCSIATPLKRRQFHDAVDTQESVEGGPFIAGKQASMLCLWITTTV